MVLFDQLPDHILVLIVSFLHPKTRVRLERVSRRFRSIIGFSWNAMVKLDLGLLFPLPGTPNDSNAVRPLMERCGRHLKEIVSNTFFQLPLEQLQGIGEFCPGIRTIRLRWPVFLCGQSTSSTEPNPDPVVEDPLWEFFLNFRVLEELSLVFPNFDTPIPVHVDFIAQFRHLKRLQLCESNLTSDTFPLLCRHIRGTLECLIVTETYLNLCDAAFVEGVSQLVNLRELSLAHLRFGCDSSFLSELNVIQMIRGLRKLEFVSLARVDRLARKGLVELAKLEHLRVLVLRNCNARGHLEAFTARPASYSHELQIFVRDRDQSKVKVDLRTHRITLRELWRFAEFLKQIVRPNSLLYERYWNVRMYAENAKYNPKRGGVEDIEELRMV